MSSRPDDESTDPGISAPLQQATDGSTESASGLVANVPLPAPATHPTTVTAQPAAPLQQATDGSTESASNLVANVPLPPAPATHPTTVTTQPAAHQVQPQSHECQPMVLRNAQIAAHITNLVLKDWVPCILSLAQIHRYRQATRDLILKIRHLEAEQEKIRLIPKDSLQLEELLFATRVEYEVRFGRIFRINDLPPEVLTNIFRYLIWSIEGKNQGNLCRLRVTWVCRHWREIALSDPMLWNAIWFKELPNFERSLAYFERSGNSPLDIRINDTPNRPISVAELQNLLNRILEKISNLRIIVVVLQDWDTVLVVLRAFCAVREKNLPMILERFEMHRNGSVSAQPGADPITLFGGATVPSFSHLSLNGIHIDWANSVLTNLTNIHIRNMPRGQHPTLSQYHALLRGSPALRQLLLDGAGPLWEEQTPKIKPIHIPSLRYLVLGKFRLKYALYICSQMSTPNVLDLTLMNFVGEDYSGLYDFLSSYTPSVKLIALYNLDIVSNNQIFYVMKWLYSMPLVTYFRIGNMKPHILDLLCLPIMVTAEGEPPTTQILCPKLAFLELDEAQIHVMINFLHNRKHLGYPLRKVFVAESLAKKVTHEQFHQLQAALVSGGTVEILTPGNRPAEEDELREEANQ